MGLTVNSYCGRKWLDVICGSREFWWKVGSDRFMFMKLIEFIDEECGGWERYVKRVKEYKGESDYVKELYLEDGLGRDKVWEFVSMLKHSFVNWLRDNREGNRFGLVKRDDGSEEYEDCWFMKWDDVFIGYSCELIGSLTMRLLDYVEVV